MNDFATVALHAAGIAQPTQRHYAAIAAAQSHAVKYQLDQGTAIGIGAATLAAFENDNASYETPGIPPAPRPGMSEEESLAAQILASIR